MAYKQVVQENTSHTPNTHGGRPAISKLWKQSIGKAVKKVDNVLPKSPSKKKVNVRALAESMGLIRKEKNKHSMQHYLMS